jgi:hypothetical protein
LASATSLGICSCTSSGDRSADPAGVAGADGHDADALDAFESSIGSRVTIIRGESQQEYDWSVTGGAYIACRPDGDEYFIRMSRSAMNSGQDDLHVDVDICGFDGPGAYPSADAYATRCQPGGRFFDVFWHAPDGAFANNAASVPCTLDISGDDMRLTIALRCDDLVRPIPSADRVSVRADASCARG